MKSIIRVSRILKWVSVGLCLGLPIVEAGYWISSGYPFLEPYFSFAQLPVFNEIPVQWANLTDIQKLLGFLSNLLPLSFTVLSVGYLAQLFQSFQRLELFEEKNAFLLKKSARALLIGQLIYPIHTGFLSLILTFYNPVGKRMCAIAIGSEQLKMIVLALAIFLISWLLKEGCTLQEENRGIV